MVNEDMALVPIKVLTEMLDTPNNCKRFQFCNAIILLMRLW